MNFFSKDVVRLDREMFLQSHCNSFCSVTATVAAAILQQLLQQYCNSYCSNTASVAAAILHQLLQYYCRI